MAANRGVDEYLPPMFGLSFRSCITSFPAAYCFIDRINCTALILRHRPGFGLRSNCFCSTSWQP